MFMDATAPSTSTQSKRGWGQAKVGTLQLGSLWFHPHITDGETDARTRGQGQLTPCVQGSALGQSVSAAKSSTADLIALTPACPAVTPFWQETWVAHGFPTTCEHSPPSLPPYASHHWGQDTPFLKNWHSPSPEAWPPSVLTLHTERSKGSPSPAGSGGPPPLLSTSALGPHVSLLPTLRRAWPRAQLLPRNTHTEGHGHPGQRQGARLTSEAPWCPAVRAERRQSRHREEDQTPQGASTHTCDESTHTG